MALGSDGRERLGTVLRGKWRIDALLGTGGMGHVYAATHRNGMRGAVKVLHRDSTRDAAMLRRFLREGYVANRVQHPGAVKMLDDDVTDDGSPFLVMELLEGDTLKDRVVAREGPLSPAEAVEAGIGILDVLAAAHAAGVIHRDIKPANVMVTREGRLKLLDFGIARVREGDRKVDATRTGSMMGTPAYMAPEQALARWTRVDHRSDLFSVGATLWMLLTNQMVHDAETLPELLIAASTQRARPIRAVSPDVPASLAEVVDRALQFEPEARWQDARAMQYALEAVRDEMRNAALAAQRANAPTVTNSQMFARLGAHSLPAPPPSARGRLPALLLAIGATLLVISALVAHRAWSSPPAETMNVAAASAEPSSLPAAASAEPSEPPTARSAESPGSVALPIPDAPDVGPGEAPSASPTASAQVVAKTPRRPAGPRTTPPPAPPIASPKAEPAQTTRPKFDESAAK